jgi:tRNA threonylcarbamoyladenosine biosynthesis protein TsaB
MLLAIDTCGALGGVALGEGIGPEGFGSEEPRVQESGPRLRFRELAGKTFSERLLGTVSELLQDAEVTLEQIRAVVVVHGPGSFTGIRIGVSAAKGLAEGLAIPAIAVSRLELLARKAPEGRGAAIFDAGRGEFYAGFYRNGQPGGESLLTREALLETVQAIGLPVVVCEPKVSEALAELQPRNVAAPTAIEALILGAERFGRGLFDDVATLDANYLRRAETEMLARIAEHAALRRAASAVAAAP